MSNLEQHENNEFKNKIDAFDELYTKMKDRDEKKQTKSTINAPTHFLMIEDEEQTFEAFKHDVENMLKKTIKELV